MFIEDTLPMELCHHFRGLATLANLPLTLEKCLLKSLKAIPVVITIHGIEAPSGGSNTSNAQIINYIFNFFEIVSCTLGRSIATISKCMNGYFFNTMIFCCCQECFQMIAM